MLTICFVAELKPGCALDELFAPSQPGVFEVVFLLAALAFNLLIAGIFVAQKLNRPRLVRALGLVWLSLALPLAIVLVRSLTAGRDLWIAICLTLVLLYMVVEWLLDYALKVPFRQKLYLHLPYIILEYIALFGLIGVAFSIDRLWGWAVSVTFWIVMAGLIYLYAGRHKGGATQPRSG